MWSEVFAHDFDNGEKVAIILLDTQGIFDSRSSVKDCTTTFAVSMMLSSVQCYNLMQNIREDDLQHLELFTEYGRLALEQSNQRPFQSLLFIVRDWPFAFETGYGYQGKQVIRELMAGNDKQTPEMRQLRNRIESSFDDIGGFLMPHPGFKVAHGNNFTGYIQEIDSDFRKYVKELVPSLFAPENLIAKKINGQKVRARDLIQYLQTYIDIFNGDTLPEPTTVLRVFLNLSIICGKIESTEIGTLQVLYLKRIWSVNWHIQFGSILILLHSIVGNDNAFNELLRANFCNRKSQNLCALIDFRLQLTISSSQPKISKFR